MTAHNTAIASAHLEVSRQRRVIECLERELKRLRGLVEVLKELVEHQQQGGLRLHELFRAESHTADMLRRDLDDARRADALAGPDPWEEPRKEEPDGQAGMA